MSQLAAAPRPGLRAVAVATIAAFGCATTRQPLPPPPPSPPVASVYFEEPEMELWVEGSERVDPAESERAQAESRKALQAAVEGRGVPAAGAEAVLHVRERAVARTSGRKTNQGLATAGIVVGVAAIVAVVVVAMVAGKGKGGGSGGSAPKSGGHATAPAPSPGRTAPAPPPGTPPLLAGTVVAHPVPVPAAPPPRLGVGVYVDVWAPPQPYAEGYAPPPAPELSVKERGFFDPDEVLLEMVLLDARSGAVLWGAAVRGWADPRDPGQVAELLETALRDQPWARRGGAPAAATPAPPASAPPAPAPPARAPPAG